jgi:hypothetical protein
MPVIRVTANPSVFSHEQRKALLDQLSNELAQATEKGPVVFEIPLDQTDKMDVLVVWEAWKDVPSEARSEIILEAYKDKKGKISQALGVTNQEAIDQHLLPYSVVPMARSGEADSDKLKSAMLAEGGLAFENGKVDLRLPTLRMAKESHQRLCDALPKGYWSIVQSADPLF